MPRACPGRGHRLVDLGALGGGNRQYDCIEMPRLEFGGQMFNASYVGMANQIRVQRRGDQPHPRLGLQQQFDLASCCYTAPHYERVKRPRRSRKIGR